MPDNDVVAISESSDWQVPATFGQRAAHHDPAWERECAAFLKATNSSQELLNMFARFRDGESAFDATMRRIVMQVMCKMVGNDLQVSPSVVLKHPETMEFG